MSLCSTLSVPTYTTIPDFPTGSLRNVNFHALINTLLVYPPAIRLNWWNCFSPGSRCVMRCLKAQSLSAPGALSLNNTVVTPLVPREKLINSLPRQLMAHIECGPRTEVDFVVLCVTAWLTITHRETDQKWTTVLWIHFCPFLCYQKTYQTQIKC